MSSLLDLRTLRCPNSGIPRVRVVHLLRDKVFLRSEMDCIGPRACPRSAHQQSAASRVYPTCGVKPGNEGTGEEASNAKMDYRSLGDRNLGDGSACVARDGFGSATDHAEIQPCGCPRYAQGQGRGEIQAACGEIHGRQGEDRGLSQLDSLQGQGGA